MSQWNRDKRYCAFCEKSFEGRSDKKYCCDQCRVAASNKYKDSHEQVIIQTNKSLRRNRTILKTLCPIGKSTIRKDELVGMGFRFDLFTSIFPTTKGVYYVVYDFAFSPIYERQHIEKVQIVNNQAMPLS